MNKSYYKFFIIPCVLFLISCGNKTQTNTSGSSEQSQSESVFLPEIKNLTVTDNGHFTDAQLGYLSKDTYNNTDPYCGNMSVSAPKPIVLNWEGNLDHYYVYLFSDIERSKKIISYDVGTATTFEFFNGQLGKTYHWDVRGIVNGNSEVMYGSSASSFTVSVGEHPGPRNLNIEGVENFRDLGGWGYFDESGNYKTYIKQGMIYRSGRFNEDKQTEPVASITENGLKEVDKLLNIKTEIDLRRTSNNEVGGLTDKSVLGDNVNYVQLPMLFGGNNILTFKGKYSGDTYDYDNPAMIKNFFEILADENNYPIDFHCSIGKDRTGCLAYLVEALLGFDQETLYRDYMFTNFANAGYCKLEDVTDRYGKTLSDYENGITINEKTYNYLHEVVGLETETLNRVISILGNN